MTIGRSRRTADRLSERLAKLVSMPWQLLRARWSLRHLDAVGSWTRALGGSPLVRNDGRLSIGRRSVLNCRYAPVSLDVRSGATVDIGDRALINYGVSIVAARGVHIGDDVSIAPYCIIDDRSLDASTAEPIRIGHGVWLASRVTVQGGTSIGAGTIVTAGSVVGGHVPAGVVIGGAPARILRTVDDVSTVDPAEPEPPPVVAPVEPIPPYSGLLISDFTIDPLAEMMMVPSDLPSIGAVVAGFGLVVPTLIDPPPSGRDLAVVWTSIDSVVEELRVGSSRSIERDQVESDVETFADSIESGLHEFRTVVVPTWTQPWWQRGRGIRDAAPGGRAWAITVANGHLMDRFSGHANIVVLDAARWIAGAGAGAYSQKLWYAGKVPFIDDVYQRASDEIRQLLAIRSGAVRKLLVLDLDNTLWGGVIGDDGIEGIRLGGHDADGEAFVELQRAIVQLRRRGVMLAIASKNDEQIALDAIDRHDAMVLRRDDFVSWRINWDDKATNIAAMVSELNIGLDAVVFLDDNPHERSRVREALPAVLVPDWPLDPSRSVVELNRLWGFDSIGDTAEDAARTDMYVVERQRRLLESTVSSVEDWIEQLHLVVTPSPLQRSNLSRATQLLNKTNQMNLSTRRLTESEFEEWAGEPGHHVITVSVADRLGDAGLTGIVSIDVDGASARIVDFVLSCRVMGRQIEQAMLAIAARTAADDGAGQITARLIPTVKNGPCRAVFEAAGMQDDEYATSTSEVRFPNLLTVAGMEDV